MHAGVAEGAELWPVEAGRYRLVAARACPWANRAIIVRRLLGLEDAISLGTPGPVHDVRSWTFDLDEGGVDPVLGTERIQENYFKRFADYPRGITVPAIVDVPTGAVVTNDYPQITLDFSTQWKAFPPRRRPGPAARGQDRGDDAGHQAHLHRGQQRRLPLRICRQPGSLRRGLRPALDRDGLARGTPGNAALPDGRGSITEADVRLFTTLVRFDPVYHGHFKANRNKLTEMPNLWAYARELFQLPGFGDTVDFDQIKKHYYVVHEDINPTQIVPESARTLENWLEPHGREALGGNPWGNGTAPEPVRESEKVTAGHNPLYPLT